MYIRSNGSSHHTRNPIRKDILYIARSGKMEVLRSAVMLPWCSISPTAKIVFTLTDVSGENGPRSHQVLALSTTVTMKSWQFRWGQPTALVHCKLLHIVYMSDLQWMCWTRRHPTAFQHGTCGSQLCSKVPRARRPAAGDSVYRTGSWYRNIWEFPKMGA